MRGQQPSISERSYPASRLRIADLLLITLGTAIVIWFWLPLERQLNMYQTAVMAAFSPLYGSSVAALLIAAFRVCREAGPVATQPGQRLLMLIGLGICVIGLVSKAVLLAEQNPPLMETVRMPLQVLCALAAYVLLLVGFISLLGITLGELEESPRWRRVFRILAAMLVAPFCAACGSASPEPLNVLAIILMVATISLPVFLVIAILLAVISDIRQRLPRDFWHWLGLAAFLGIPVHMVLLTISATI